MQIATRVRMSWVFGAVAASILSITGCSPPSEPPAATAWIPAGTCFDAASSPDVLYTGPDNHVENTLGYSSTDGSCSGAPLGAITLVHAVDQASADALCASLTPGTPVGLNLLDSGVVTTPPLPTDAWQCWFAPAPG